MGAAVGDWQGGLPAADRAGHRKRTGMDFDQASSLADELGLGISKSSGFQAHASGVNEAAAKSLTESVATADDIGQILPDQVHNQVYAAGNNATEEVLDDTYTLSSVERNSLQNRVNDDKIGNDIKDAAESIPLDGSGTETILTDGFNGSTSVRTFRKPFCGSGLQPIHSITSAAQSLGRDFNHYYSIIQGALLWMFYIRSCLRE